MKKVLAIVLTLVLAMVLLAGCAQENAPENNSEPVADTPTEVTMYQGLGRAFNFREGPGSDAEDVPVYSFNTVWAAATFDEDGRVLDVTVDILEVATPNYDGAGMPHFIGWPGTEGYNLTDHNTGEVAGVTDNTLENVKAEFDLWMTKRERGTDYHMNPRNEWFQQMDYIEEWMKGKTMSEIEDWFVKYCSDRNGRPLNPDTDNEEDLAKVGELNEEEVQEVVDFRTGATMSLSDAHGDILGAVKNAYENKVEVVIPVSSAQ